MAGVGEFIAGIASLMWPAVLLYVVWSHRTSVSALIDSARSRGFTLEVGGQKLTMADVSHQQQEAIEDLQEQVVELKQRIAPEALNPLVEVHKTRSPTASETASVLWVDDNPKNNSFFIDLLKRRGYRVDLASSTVEGLQLAARTNYRLILSDMGRQEGNEAGLNLFESLNKRDNKVPFVIFCSARSVSWHRRKFLSMGGKAITASATELRAVLDELAPAPDVGN